MYLSFWLNSCCQLFLLRTLSRKIKLFVKVLLTAATELCCDDLFICWFQLLSFTEYCNEQLARCNKFYLPCNILLYNLNSKDISFLFALVLFCTSIVSTEASIVEKQLLRLRDKCIMNYFPSEFLTDVITLKVSN